MLLLVATRMLQQYSIAEGRKSSLHAVIIGISMYDARENVTFGTIAQVSPRL